MFIDTVKTLLQEKNISVNKMAQDLHFGTGTFRTWETRGTVPDGETLLKIARYFHVSVDFLLGNEIHHEESDATEKTTFWNNVVTLCNRKRINPTSVCMALELPCGTADAWEKGAVPEDTTLQRIASFFSVAPDKLLNDTLEPKWDTIHAIYDLCRYNKTSPMELGSMLDIPASVISGLKFGAVPDVEILSKIAIHFRVTTEYLLSGEYISEIPNASPMFLTPREVQVALAYRAQDDAVKAAIDKMLDLPPLVEEGLA